MLEYQLWIINGVHGCILLCKSSASILIAQKKSKKKARNALFHAF